MKVKIGPYKSYWGAYQIADLLNKVGVSKDRCYEIGKRLSETKLQEFLDWIYSKRKRKVYVKIDNFDAWNADYTIGVVIHNVLKEYIRQGVPGAYIHVEDVPSEFHQEIIQSSGFSSKAFEWIVNEIIWASDPEWEDKHITYPLPSNYSELITRRNKAMYLFGKYYFNFWN